MKLRLLDILACPDCRGGIAVKDGGGAAGEISEGRLGCASCGRLFKIERGVPDFSPQRLYRAEATTAECFAYEWTNFNEFEFEGEKKAFLDWIDPIDEGFFKGKLVLDAGCGMGRHTHLASTFGAREVVGADLSDAVYAASETTRKLDNAHIVKADLRKLPFPEGTFDYIFSIGVLHHLESPEEGFQKLAAYLRPGGAISIWVYGAEGNGAILYMLDPVRKLVLSRLPLGMAEKLSFGLAVVLWPLLKGVYRPADGKKLFAERLFPYGDYLRWLSQWDLKKVAGIIFDHIRVPVAHYLPRERVSAWFSGGGWTDVRLSRRNNNSWRCSAVKNP